MKLLLIVVNEEFIDDISSALIENGFSATEVASTGEFVKYGDTILLLGVNDGEEDRVVEVMRNASHYSGNADEPFFKKVSMYVISLEKYEKIMGVACK